VLGYRATEEKYLDAGFWRARAGGGSGGEDPTSGPRRTAIPVDAERDE
jgi:hypothetical protein